MPECEMCGREGPVQKLIIEGAPMIVCAQCSRFGKPIEAPKKEKGSLSYSRKAPSTFHPQNRRVSRPKTPSYQRGGNEKILLDDYGQIIQRARKSLGLSRREFAHQIKETESLLARIENQKLIPSDRVAKKIEKDLDIKLYGDPLEISVESEKVSSSQTTIGAVVSIKKRKKDK